MNQCVDSAKHPDELIECRGSGKVVAKILHPICKVWVYLGTYNTPEEARDVSTQKHLEYESPSSQEKALSLRTNVEDFKNYPGIWLMKSGKWSAKITHNNLNVSLGTYDTPIEAVDSYNLSKLELGSKRISSLRKEGGSVYRVKSVKWKPEIQKGNVRYKIGSYATSEDDMEALNRKKRKLGMKKDEDAEAAEQSRNNQERCCAYLKQSGGMWRTEIENPITKSKVYLGSFNTVEEAEEAYNKKKCEFDLMVHSHKKCKLNDDGGLDLCVVDSYGKFVGEYSRLDDELWLCL